MKRILWIVLACAGISFGCGEPGEGSVPVPEPRAETANESLAPQLDPAALRERASGLLEVLPESVPRPDDPVTEEQIALGRVLFHDPRFSRSQEISCNSCHRLDRFGVDGEPTSPGHKGKRGERNSPSVYNAALHIAQFWDGRAADVEEQALGPILNPIEMAMADEVAVLAVLGSVPGYKAMFEAAFPGEDPLLTFDNVGRAIGAFERQLLTPGPLDAFLQGDDAALTPDQLDGLDTFLSVGCPTCHNGAAVGGGMYQKLGLVKPYPTEDPGRAAITGNQAELHFFKVPSLRNVAETGPYFHDGSVRSLDEAIRIMGEVQLGVDLNHGQIQSIRAFLEALTGEPPAALAAPPELPESGPDTPVPDRT